MEDRTLIGIGAAFGFHEAMYCTVLPERSPYLDKFVRILRDRPVKVFHNGSGFDLDVISWFLDLPTALDMCEGMADTSIMGQVQGVPSVSLSNMAQAYCNYKIQEIADILPKGKKMLDLPPPDVAWKCLHDCLATYRLYYKMDGPKWLSNDEHTWTYTQNTVDGYDPTEPTSYTVTGRMKDCYHVDRQLVPILLKMSRRGMAINQSRLETHYQRVAREKLYYENICLDEGFEPSKNQQVGYILSSRGNFLPFTKTKKQLKTDEDTIASLKDPLATVVLEYRDRAKLKSTYLEPWRGAERAYTHFRQDLSTMRLASSGKGYIKAMNPMVNHRNLQNIPDSIRDIFEPDNGTWSYADYSQMELRIMAYMAEEPTMLKAFESGQDIHTLTQMELWPGSSPKDNAYRGKAKIFNLAGGIYLSSAKTLSIKTGLPVKVCQEKLNQWFHIYPNIAQWQGDMAEWGLHYGWVPTLFGRRCRLPKLESGIPHIEKCAANYPDQGTGADIIKRAMLWIEAQGVTQALQIHDEILVDGGFGFDPYLENILDGLHLPLEIKHSRIWTKAQA